MRYKPTQLTMLATADSTKKLPKTVQTTGTASNDLAVNQRLRSIVLTWSSVHTGSLFAYCFRFFIQLTVQNLTICAYFSHSETVGPPFDLQLSQTR